MILVNLLTLKIKSKNEEESQETLSLSSILLLCSTFLIAKSMFGKMKM